MNEKTWEDQNLWRGNWDKNANESSFTPLDHKRNAIELYIVLSDYILHVVGSGVILFDRTSFYRIIYFMWLDRTSCHWIRYVIRSGQRLFKKVCFPECFSRYVSANMAAHVQGQHRTAQEQLTASDIKTVLLGVMDQLASRLWLV